jgi:hypothetical protein
MGIVLDAGPLDQHGALAACSFGNGLLAKGLRRAAKMKEKK